MRDGARLETIFMTPRGRKGPLPILFMRTPYGVRSAAPATVPSGWAALDRDGYIFVEQSMRGRAGSDGVFTFSTALHADPAAVDEATDAYDSIDWLVKNVPGNNGRVGMWGVSYPGLAAGMALIHPHPALKAVSPQAAWVDYWANDDLHRGGALRLSYATDWTYMLQHSAAAVSDFVYDAYDSYDWFLARGSVDAIDRDVFHHRIAMFTALIDHPDHDGFYTGQRWSDALGRTTVPTLDVAGYWDQEDPWGSWQIYFRQERDDPDHLVTMVAGPWNHGGWRGAADSLGPIPFGIASGTMFREQIEAPFFAYWLHDKGPRPAPGIRSFQSGSWTWHDYPAWPPAGGRTTALYLRADGSLSFTAPSHEACRSYVADPASPVPYRRRPMSGTYLSPDWKWWEAADQRFLGGRPDVLSYLGAPLAGDLTITGSVVATLRAASSGTDADFVVKLIDVYPDDGVRDPAPADDGDYAASLNGYQLPVAMEVRRGRWLDSDTTPAPLIPGQVRDWTVSLREHDHVFRRGHRIMVQVQSSWFPVIDRNPQTFVANIAHARAADFVKATQSVCPGSQLSLPVVG